MIASAHSPNHSLVYFDTNYETSMNNPSAGEVIWKNLISSPPIESIRYPTCPFSQGPLATPYLLPARRLGTLPTGSAFPTELAVVVTLAGLSSRETLIPPGEFICIGAMLLGSKVGGRANTRLHVLPDSDVTSKTNKVERVGDNCALS